MGFWRNVKRVVARLEGQNRAGFDETTLAANLRPRIGARVQVIHDHGPPGLEHTNGWLGTEGIVIDNDTADRIGASAVLMRIEDLPFPTDIWRDGVPDELFFLWEPASLSEVGDGRESASV